MKKFFKILGAIIAVPIQFLFIIYSIPLFILDVLTSILLGSFKDWKYKVKTRYNIFKTGLENIMKGNIINLGHRVKLRVYNKKGHLLQILEYSNVKVY